MKGFQELSGSFSKAKLSTKLKAGFKFVAFACILLPGIISFALIVGKSVGIGIAVLLMTLAAFSAVFIVSAYSYNEITKILDRLSDYAHNIAEGNFKAEATELTSEKYGRLGMALIKISESLRLMEDDVNMMTRAALEGKFEARAELKKHQGSYKEIIKGFNRALDAIIMPLSVTAASIDKISKGEIPSKITDDFKGDFVTIKNNLNDCIDAVNNLITDANMLNDAAYEGRLSVRAQVDRHQGDYRKIIEGVNHMLDSFVNPIQEASLVLNAVAAGDLGVYVQGEYNGNFAQIKNALNDTVSSLSSYIREISETLSSMSAGDLDVAIKSEFKGEFALIKDSMNNIIASLNATLGDIRVAAEEVASGADQVSDGSQQLSAGSAAQASAVDELTSAITNIAAKTKRNAENADRAFVITNEVKTNANNGNGQMKQMLTAMEDINASSANVNKIIKVISDIAFQTNILALNASVEAARAGQYGKGFAVVADEVRNLSVRSTAAVEETTELIENSIEKSDMGMRMAKSTAASLKKIVDGIEEAAMLVGDISASSNEQATGVAEINRGIDQVAQVVQTNSATAEEEAASSEELSGQSALLKEKLDRFKLKMS